MATRNRSDMLKMTFLTVSATPCRPTVVGLPFPSFILVYLHLFLNILHSQVSFFFGWGKHVKSGWLALHLTPYLPRPSQMCLTVDLDLYAEINIQFEKCTIYIYKTHSQFAYFVCLWFNSKLDLLIHNVRCMYVHLFWVWLKVNCIQ